MALSVAQGKVVGTGSAITVSGLTFQPRVLILKQDGNTVAYLCTDTMGAGNAIEFDGQNAAGILTGYVTTLNSDGFTLGTNANINTAALNIFWVALGDAAGTELLTGSYAGTGAGQSITGLAARPVLISYHTAALADGAGYQTSDMTANTSAQYHGSGNGGVTAVGRIVSLDTNGFTLGTNVSANTNGDTYYYWGVAANALFASIHYTGDGTASHAIAGLGLTPNVVVTRDSSASNNTGAHVTTAMLAAGTNGLYFSAHNTAFDNAMWVSLDSNGFTLNSSVAGNQSATVYNAYAFKVGSNNPVSQGMVVTTFNPGQTWVNRFAKAERHPIQLLFKQGKDDIPQQTWISSVVPGLTWTRRFTKPGYHRPVWFVQGKDDIPQQATMMIAAKPGRTWKSRFTRAIHPFSNAVPTTSPTAILKVAGVTMSAVSKVSGVAKVAISKISGVNNS